MAVIDELLRSESNGNISFGNHELAAKAKLEDYEHAGDMYKVKTFQGITKLEKNGLFLYESVPGTSVHNFCESENGISFTVEGSQDAQITVGTEDDSEYEVIVGAESAGVMKTNLSGKLSVSVELEGSGEVEVKIIKK
ncbi:MAG: endosialidase [Lachnospiraceae bacterium]|nr:endosialidase [Lachnospiraceae bacterium]MDE7031034.1 endosialidase [Lachnospiraceae bacterium]